MARFCTKYTNILKPCLGRVNICRHSPQNFPSNLSSASLFSSLPFKNTLSSHFYRKCIVTSKRSFFLPVEKFSPMYSPFNTNQTASRTLNLQKAESAMIVKRFLTKRKKNIKIKNIPKAPKTRKGVAKRLVIANSGQIKRGHAGLNHLNRKLRRKTKRKLGQKEYLIGTYLKKMKRLMSM